MAHSPSVPLQKMMVLSVHGSRHKWSHSPASTQAQQYCREQEEPTLVGGLRGFIFETRLGWILPPKKECRAQVHQGPPVTPQKTRGTRGKKRSAEGVVHCCQVTWEEQGWFLSTKCQSTIIWKDKSSSQLKADAETTIIIRKDISHLLFVSF